jgi:hypothetical protein
MANQVSKATILGWLGTSNEGILNQVSNILESIFFKAEGKIVKNVSEVDGYTTITFSDDSTQQFPKKEIIDILLANQTTGFIAHKNRVDLPSVGDSNKAYLVLDDSVDEYNNGTWGWDGSAYYQAAKTVAQNAEESNKSIGVSGFGVVKAIKAFKETLVTTPTVNLYEKEDDVAEQYVNVNNGINYNNIGQGSISKIYSCVAGDKVYLNHRTGGQGFKFIDSNGSFLKPLHLDGVEMSNYGQKFNGVFLAPANAVGYQFTTKYNGVGNQDNIVLNINEEEVLYETIKNSLLVSEKNKVRVNLGSQFLQIGTEYNDVYDLSRGLRLSRAVDFASNSNINLFTANLVYKGDVLTNNKLFLKDEQDDIAPIHLNGSFIGGNHGWDQPYILTKAHSKTLADVGSILQDANSVNFTILRIISSTQLVLCSENIAVDGFTYSFTAPSGNLTYVSDGGNTDTITSGYSLASVANLVPITTPSNSKVYLNGKTEITIEGEYNCEFVDVVEDYDVYDLPSVLQKITSERPVGGYLTEVYFNELGAEKLFNNQITYRYLPNGKGLVNHNFFAYKKCELDYDGFTQSIELDSGKLVVPKCLPITVGADTFDLRNITPWNSADAPSGNIEITDAYFETPSNPPSRFLNFNDDIIYHSGYILDRGIGINRIANIDKAFRTGNSRKLYLIGVNVPTTLEANTTYSCLAYRNYTIQLNKPTARTSYDYLEIDNKVFLFLDYNDSINDEISMPLAWRGRKMIVSSSNNVGVVGVVVNSTLKVNVDCSSRNNGYAEIIID